MPAELIDGCLYVRFGSGDMHIGHCKRPGGVYVPAVSFHEGEPLPIGECEPHYAEGRCLIMTFANREALECVIESLVMLRGADFPPAIGEREPAATDEGVTRGELHPTGTE